MNEDEAGNVYDTTNFTNTHTFNTTTTSALVQEDEKNNMKERRHAFTWLWICKYTQVKLYMRLALGKLGEIKTGTVKGFSG